ncbi:MAG: cyclic nucleotide-binding domain-containing protein, partial [Lewinella sp.]|nr:cyclic nucleotide-binding domain-containing protein [Lewinella sp.]
MELEQIINRIYPLPATSLSIFKKNARSVCYPKGTILLKAGRVENNVYFIRKGIVRAYVYQNDHEVTFWFGREGEAVISMKSYIDSEPGYEDIELLEDCELYSLTSEDLHRLYEQNIHIANWGRKFAEKELL